MQTSREEARWYSCKVTKKMKYCVMIRWHFNKLPCWRERQREHKGVEKIDSVYGWVFIDDVWSTENWRSRGCVCTRLQRLMGIREKKRCLL